MHNEKLSYVNNYELCIMNYELNIKHYELFNRKMSLVTKRPGRRD